MRVRKHMTSSFSIGGSVVGWEWIRDNQGSVVKRPRVSIGPVDIDTPIISVNGMDSACASTSRKHVQHGVQHSGLYAPVHNTHEHAPVIPVSEEWSNNQAEPAVTLEEFNEDSFLRDKKRLVLVRTTDTDIKPDKFDQLSVLEHISFAGVPSLGVAALHRAFMIHTLRSLDLGGCASVNSTVLRLICENTNKLEFLSVARCNGVNATGVKYIAKITSLRFLDMSGCVSLTTRGAVRLSALRSLEYLSLAGCTKLGPGVIDSISQLTSLVVLDLSNCSRVAKHGLDGLASLSNLARLNLSRCLESPVQMDFIQCMTRLAFLNLTGWKHAERAQVACIGELGALNTLILDESYPVDDGMLYIGQLASLETLSLDGCPAVSSGCLARLSGLHRLKVLRIRNCPKINNSALEHVAWIKSLRTLEIGQCGPSMTARGFGHVASLPNLKTFRVCGVGNLSATHFQRLAKSRSIETLSLRGCDGVTEDGVAHLNDLNTLRTLDLSASRNITLGCIVRLARRKQLLTLVLGSCNTRLLECDHAFAGVVSDLKKNGTLVC